jgi:WD40 repeat protein
MRTIAAALATLAVLTGSGSASSGNRGCPAGRDLGRVAYVRGGALHLLDLATCAERILVQRSVSGPVRFARGGRYVRYGGVWIVSTSGGKPVRVARETGVRSPDGRRVAQSRGRNSIWVGGREIYRTRGGPPVPFAWSPDSRWLLFYVDPMASASIIADGVVLQAIPATGGRARRVAAMLGYPDYLAWCGRKLVVTAGGSRIATENKWLALAAAPRWHARALLRLPASAWGSIACTRDGTKLAVQSQPVSHDARFFSTRWSLWAVGLDGSRSRLTRPPEGHADESPRWSRDGRSLLFVRSRRGLGRLYLWRGGQAIGPLASFGYSLGYYGHHDWWYAADWSQ